MQTALTDIEMDKANLLIVYSISRLSRNVEHQQIIKKRLERAGAKLVICDRPIEDTEEGERMFGITCTFAQYERKLIRKRTMEGRRRLAATQSVRHHVQSGLFPGSPEFLVNRRHPIGALSMREYANRYSLTCI
jgi:DNA invertase Pin-like site-specific DNA recombinase